MRLIVVLPGTHASLQLAIAALWALTVGICAYGVLRSLGVATLHALVIAALILAYPWYDSLRMWSTSSQASLSITFALGGLWLTLHRSPPPIVAVAHRRRRSIPHLNIDL